MKSKPNEIKPIKHSNLYIFLGILAGVLLIAGVIAYKYVADYHIPLQQLERVSQDLRPIYDKLLEKNKGNVASSYYRNECSESSVKYGRGRVSCGPSSKIVLSKKLDTMSVEVGIDDFEIPNFTIDIEGSVHTKEESALVYIQKETEIRCWISYASEYGYDVSCRKEVSDLLPGFLAR